MTDATCSVPGCGRKFRARGWCGSHWNRWKKTGDIQADVPFGKLRPKPTCSEAGCGRPVNSHGLCGSHERRRKGEISAGQPIRRYNPGQPCEVEGCDRVSDGRGLCSGHRQRLKIWGELRPDVPLRVWTFTPGGKCLNEECPLPTVTLGLCKTHLGRYRRDQRRARLAGATIEAFDRIEVFDRDGWMCGICNEPVDRSVRFPDPSSVSLDHIIPLSRGGDHSRANCQTAHRICNLRKGARLDGDFGERSSA